MKTPEQVAESLVQVVPYESSDGTWWVCFAGHRTEPPVSGEANLYDSREDAEYDAAVYRKAIAAAVGTYGEALLAGRAAGVPGGLTAERLAEISFFVRETLVLKAGNLSKAEAAAIDQASHIDHLEAVLRDCAEDGLLDRRNELINRGRREGWKAAREACVKKVQTVKKAWGHVTINFKEDVASVIEAVPETPPEEMS